MQLCIKNTFEINIFYNGKSWEPYNCSDFILSWTRLEIRERYYINGIPLYFNASVAKRLWIRPLKWLLQEVPTFRDFWYQEESRNAGNHEIRGLFLV